MNTIRKRIYLAGLIIGLGLGFTQTASATVIVDNYWGGTPTSGVDTDSIGPQFELHSMSVSISTDNILSVTIKSDYSQSGTGVGFGDLFLASSWNPFGPAPYVDDDHTTGTLWEYGLSIDDAIHGATGQQHNRYTSASGTVSLYALNGATNDSNVLLSDDWYISGGAHRAGQEVAVDTSSGTVADTGVDGTYSSWMAGLYNYLNFEIDLTGTSLEGSNDLALHWTMTCGNDVIEGTGVPEPGILAMLAAGLLGFGITIARRKRQ